MAPTYKHFLNFRNETNFGKIEITEMVGFDGFTSKIEQKSNGFARDVFFGGESQTLEFRNGFYGERLAQPQQLANGQMIEFKTNAFDQLLFYYDTYGFESEIIYSVQIGNSETEIGQLMFTGVETDRLIYFKCSVINNRKRAVYKRNERIKTNVFSNVGIEQQAVNLPKVDKLLLKAKPLDARSEWNASVEEIFIPGQNFNIINNVIQSEIQNTLSFIGGIGSINDFQYIEAKNNIVNGKLKIKINLDFRATPVFEQQNVKLFWGVFATFSDDINDYTQVFSVDYSSFVTPVNVSNEWTFNNIDIPIGHRLFIFFRRTASFGEITLLKLNTTGENSILFEGTEIGIDSVVSGVRLYDLIKNKSEHISNLPVFADDFQANGKHYYQHAFNGKMLRQVENDFVNSFEEVLSSVCDELGYDFDIKETGIFIKKIDDFYLNEEGLVLEQAPNSNYKETFNDKLLLNTFEYKYQKFEQDKDERGSIDAVHTETQWKFANKMVENNYAKTINHIRDPFLIERLRRNNVSNNKTTSLSEDDSLIVCDTLPIAPNQKGGFSYRVAYQTNGNILKISNRTPNDDSFNFRWDLLGFKVGASFNILSGNNIGNYTVIEIDPNVLTIQGNSNNINFNGISLSRFEYTLNDVDFVVRTNEGLQTISGVANPTRFINLRYTIRRNLENYFSLFGSALLYSENKLRNTEYKVNSNLVSKFQDDPNEVIEVSDIEPTNAIIKPILVEIETVANDDFFKQLLNEPNKFIRVLNNETDVIRGYFVEAEINWATMVLSLKLELKNDDNIIEVNSLNWFSYQINGDFVMFFDEQSRLLLKPKIFKSLSIDGQLYENLINFVENLEND